MTHQQDENRSALAPLPTTRKELLALHAQARRRRDAAPLGSEAYRRAALEVGEIEIEKLVRDADLNSLLTETRCRTITGAHTYIPISNFPELASDDTYSADEYKRLIQGIHIYQREVSRIVESIEGIQGLRVHFQGPKLHALFYRPIDDAKDIARRVFFLMAVVRDFVEHVFNPAFPNYADFQVSGGADYFGAAACGRLLHGRQRRCQPGKQGMKLSRSIIYTIAVLYDFQVVFNVPSLPRRKQDALQPGAERRGRRPDGNSLFTGGKWLQRRHQRYP